MTTIMKKGNFNDFVRTITFSFNYEGNEVLFSITTSYCKQKHQYRHVVNVNDDGKFVHFFDIFSGTKCPHPIIDEFLFRYDLFKTTGLPF